jgi:predicted TIM-barrel fold metal-dependent hydrolase
MGQKLPVMVGGKRVKTIDVHAHCQFHEAGALLGADAAAMQLPPVNGAPEAFIEIDKRLAAMDAQAVDLEVLSINPFWYGRDRDLAAQIVKIQNEKLAEFCASKPDRFAAFASLTLQAPDLAVQELETAVKKQGLKGAAIGCIVDGVEFSDPKFHPVWAKAEQLGVPLFIHPQRVPELNKRFSGNGWLGNTIGYPLQTTIALSHLIFEGTFDRFPGLKVIAAHGGGFLPSYADRRRSDRAGQRLSLSLAAASRRPHFRLGIAQRRRKGRHPRPHRGKTVQFHRLTSAIPDGHRRLGPRRHRSQFPIGANVHIVRSSAWEI